MKCLVEIVCLPIVSACSWFPQPWLPSDPVTVSVGPVRLGSSGDISLGTGYLRRPSLPDMGFQFANHSRFAFLGPFASSRTPGDQLFITGMFIGRHGTV